MTAIAPIQATPIFTSESAGISEAVDQADQTAAGATGGSPIASFGDFLSSAVSEANSADFAATQKVEALASGASDDLHGTMISVKEADISIRLVGTVRNKILDAFQELWRTSV